MMTRVLFVPILCAALGSASDSATQGSFEKIVKAADDAASTVVDTGKKIGTAIEDTVTSTEGLVTNEDRPEETRAELDAMQQATLNRPFGDVAGSQMLFDDIVGYAVFDTRRVTVFPLTAGFGRGVEIDRATENAGFDAMGVVERHTALGLGQGRPEFEFGIIGLKRAG